MRRDDSDIHDEGERPDAADASAHDDDAREPQRGNQVACLGLICSRFSLPFNAQAVRAVLPAIDGQADPALFVRAAQVCGIDASATHMRPSRVSPLVTPFVTFLKDGSALLVEVIDHFRGIAEIVLPLEDDPVPVRRRIALSKLDFESSREVIYITPAGAAAQDELEDHAPVLAKGNLLWRVFGAYWPSWLVVIVAAATINLLALASPLFIMNVYDRVLPNFAIPTLWALSAGVAIALIFDAMLKQSRAALLDRTGSRVDRRISAELFGHVMRVRLDRFPPGTGGLANTIREIETVRDFFTSASLVAVTDFLFIGIFLVVVWLIAGPLAYIPAAAVGVVLAVTALSRFPISRSIRQSAAHVTQRQSLLVESLTGLEALRLVGAEGKRQHLWERVVAAAAGGTSRAKSWASLANVTTGFALQMVSVLIIVWGVFLVLEGRITVGALIAANILSSRVLQPLSSIVQTLARSGQAFQAMRRIQGLMALPGETGIEAGGATISDGRIEFRNVTFSYPGASRPALNEVSFVIEPGERVGIIGAVGSGKSTMGRLIGGLYDAGDGMVLIDGRDIRQYPRAALRDRISVSGQDAVLFSGTIGENIALGAHDASQKAIDEAAELAGVANFARLLPQGLATPVAERGANLSGGQRQAIALARSLLRKPKVIFLDEPTSAMDATREAEFLSRLDAFCGRERSMILATHKASVLGLVDRLLVFDGGRLAMQGPRDKVLAELQGMQRKAKPAEAAK